MRQIKSELDKIGELLGSKYRRKLRWMVSAQAFLSLFELLFLAIVSLSVFAFSRSQPTLIAIPFTSTQLSMNLVSLAPLLLCTALIRTLGSLLILRKTNHYFAVREAEISTIFARQFFKQKWDQKAQSHSSSFVQIYGSLITIVFNMILRKSIQQIGDFFTLLAIVVGLLIVKPEIALVTACYFTVILILILKFTILKLKGIGFDTRELARENLKSMLEAQTLSREISVSQGEMHILQNLYSQRLQLGNLAKEQNYLQSLPRQLLELGLVAGLSLALLVTSLLDVKSGVLETIALVTAASFRIIPSINSIAVGYGNLKNALPYLDRVMTTAKELSVDFETELNMNSISGPENRRFMGDLILENVSYCYPGKDTPTIKDFNLRLSANQSLWISGESGIGKSTILMLIVGFLVPTSGSVYESINGKALAIGPETSGICYLSQEFALLDDTFARNIALRDITETDIDSLREAAELAGILELIDSMENGFDTKIGENGCQLSRGERQRLGLARIMFSKPQLLILDEPTSSLDDQNEKFIWEFLGNLHGKTSVIIVSHRVPPSDIIDLSIDLGFKNKSTNKKVIE